MFLPRYGSALKPNILAQRNSVRLDNTIDVAQVHLMLRLFYENVVDG